MIGALNRGQFLTFNPQPDLLLFMGEGKFECNALSKVQL
jgi:hypothetical protein